ncbi:MAG: pyrroline-5-carboxylate reductase [Rhodobacteraceae bacterium]|nr:pyrroline-5-carboxylate reductase [Paracoccaceae bacterium]
MDFSAISGRGLVLLGCGKMGSAMLQGWLAAGLAPEDVWVVEPHPSEWLAGIAGLHLNADLPRDPAVVIVAVKPQIMNDALPLLHPLGDGGTVFLSVAAGTPISAFESSLGRSTPVVRAMPNTPAAIGRGITALIGNSWAGEEALVMAEGLLSAVGETVRLSDEAEMDAVTGVSGSGPAYVFHMIEALAAAGEAEGLTPELAMQLARATVAGAGALAMESGESAEQLRINVTSPNGTTQAGLEVLMSDEAGLGGLMGRTVAAAAARSRELGS